MLWYKRFSCDFGRFKLTASNHLYAIDLATAFKKLIREKVAIEAVLKASTPLEDLSDVEALEAHLRNMAYKSDVRTNVFSNSEEQKPSFETSCGCLKDF